MSEPQPEALHALLSRPASQPRGIPPSILLSQVRNTAPFVFSEPLAAPYLDILRTADWEATPDHLGYFKLCLSAHYATVATYVPTDVDSQIRYRLWHPSVSKETISQMAVFVEQSRSWDVRPVSRRLVESPVHGVLSGHAGEWLGCATAAYGALRRSRPKQAAGLLEQIADEVHREAEFFHEALGKGDAIALLKIATILAHNLGDLDRVVDLWNLTDNDPLRKAFYKCGNVPMKGGLRWLFGAGELNKAMMASENHRNFALRRPRALRRSSDFLLPIGPFFDDWGRRLARHPALETEEVAEVAGALIDGWQWLAKTAQENKVPQPVGYARALCGIVEGFPNGEAALCRQLPARSARALRAGTLRSFWTRPRARFEASISQGALKCVQEAMR